MSRIALAGGLAASLLWLAVAPVRPDEPAPPPSPLVRLLEGGRVPPERQPIVIEQIARRGSPADLQYLFRKSIDPDGFPAPVRPRALAALADAARTRRVRPAGDLSGLAALIQSGDPALRLAATELAGTWKLESLAGPLRTLALAEPTDPPLRSAALESLTAIGGEAARGAIEELGGPGRPPASRVLSVAALAQIDPDAAAGRVAGVLRDLPPHVDPAPMIAAFLNRQGGADRLAATLAAAELPPDAARLALRTVYARGRSDPALVDVLTRAAGLDAEVRPLDPPALERLVSEVAARGDAARGEQVFRRPDLNCTGCHAVAGAGGNVGPDLGPIGSTSPVDYLINSIMLPDQAVKEQYQTLIVLTQDGQVYQGIVADRDDQRIVLREATGDLRTVPVAEIEDQKPGGSLMPKGLVNFMTRAELVDLLRFLSELGRPGPYAIPPPTAIRRWRAFANVPDILRDNRPESIQVHTDLLNADPARWVPAYGLVSGDLPLDELKTVAAGPVLYLLVEIEVGAAGPAAVRLDSAEGVTAWLNSRPLDIAGHEAAFMPDPGVQRLVFRVDTSERPARSLRAELAPPAGSPARVAVVGGK